MLFELALPPRAHHPRQRNAHRTHFLATPAKSRSIWQMPSLIDTDQARRQNSAHGSRIHPPISVTADRMIDRTMVHTGPAADAAQHVAKHAGEHRRSPVVEQHYVVFAGTVGVVGATRASRKRRID